LPKADLRSSYLYLLHDWDYRNLSPHLTRTFHYGLMSSVIILEVTTLCIKHSLFAKKYENQTGEFLRKAELTCIVYHVKDIKSFQKLEIVFLPKTVNHHSQRL
jgi:hypothetical protein